MGNSDNIMSFKKPNLKQQVLFGKLYEQCQELTLKHLKTIIQRMFDNADDTLFSLAEKTDSTTDSTAYFDSMRIIRLKRSEIETQHFDFIKNAFAELKNIKESEQPEEDSLHSFSLDNLSLIEDADLEENIAIKNIVSKVSHHCPRDLTAIEKRLSHILGREVTSKNNPLGPEVICNTFMQAATELDIELKVSLIILKLFDQELISGITPLLNEVNSLFVNANILPEFKHTIQRSQHVEHPNQNNQNRDHQNNTENNPVNPTQDAFQSQYTTENIQQVANGTQNTSIAHFHQLLAQQAKSSQGESLQVGMQNSSVSGAANNVHPINPQQGITGAAMGSTTTATMQAASAGQVVSTPQFIGSLTQLQSIPLNMIPHHSNSMAGDEDFEKSDTNSTENLKQFVIQQLQQQDANFSVKNISPIDQDVIDVVSMLFDFILEDKNIPDAAKAHIARLQIPLLKAAIIDKEFFSTNKNTARCLLNELAHAALGIIDEKDPSSINLLTEIERVVDTINNNLEDDLGLFSEQLEIFNQFMEHHEHQEENISIKIEKKIKRKEDNALAYQWVEDTVEEILKDKHLPESIVDLIDGPWKKVMLNTYLNNGQNSDTWKNQVRFIDVLEWSIQPKNESVDRQKLAKIIGQLVLTLRNGLQVIQVSNEDIQSILEQLEPFHHASIKGLSVKDYLATLTPHQSFLFAGTDNNSNETETIQSENVNEIIINDAPDTDNANNSINTEDTNNNEQTSSVPTNGIVLEEIDYEADENYKSDLSLDEIDQTILKMEQELTSLEELANSIDQENSNTSAPQTDVTNAAGSEIESSLEQQMEDDFILLDENELSRSESNNFDKIITEDIVLSGYINEDDDNPEDQPQDEYLELARHLEQGKWVEFTDDSNQKTRAKLAWKSDLLGEYTFLNWKFDVVADKTLYGLAADLRRGSATIIDDIPLVDRALSAVMSSLTPSGSASSSSQTN